MNKNNEKQVLVVDDEHISQVILKSLLTALGYQVTIANNGQEAVLFFQQNFFPMVFMDFNMPIMNGIEATVSIRKLDPQASSLIVGLTASTDPKKMQEGLNAGMDLVLNKPLEATRLQQLCENRA